MCIWLFKPQTELRKNLTSKVSSTLQINQIIFDLVKIDQSKINFTGKPFSPDSIFVNNLTSTKKGIEDEETIKK